MRTAWHAAGHGPDLMEWTNVFTLRQGKIVLMEYFWDQSEALRVAGLSE